MSYSSGSWAYKNPITTQKLNQMIENTVRVSRNRIIGCEISTTGSATVEISPGVMEFGGSWLSETTTANLVLSAENNAHWREGTTQEATSTSWYVYAYNSAGNSFSIKFGLSAPAYSDTASATANGPILYDKSGSTWFRAIGFVANDSGADNGSLFQIFQEGEQVYYETGLAELSMYNGNPDVNWADVDCSRYVPTLCKEIVLNVNVTVTTIDGLLLRKDGLSGTAAGSANVKIGAHSTEGIFTNAKVPVGDGVIGNIGTIEVREQTAGRISNATLHILGYTMNRGN